MKEGWKAAGLAALAVGFIAGIAGYLAVVHSSGDAAPRDGRAWVIEARGRMEAGHFKAAAEAYEKGLEASHKVALDPQVWCELADATAMAQGGKLHGRPRELVAKALQLDPNHPRALEMAGSAAYEEGDYPLALRYWERLLAQLSPGTGAYTDLSAAISRTRALL